MNSIPDKIALRLTEEERSMVAEIVEKLLKESRGARRISFSDALRYCLHTTYSEITRKRKG